MTKVIFNTVKRLKKLNLKSMRKAGDLPGNVYGLNLDSTQVIVNTNKFINLHNQVGDTGLVYLQIEGDDGEVPVLIDEVQLDPVSDLLVHVAFKRVNLKEKISAEIPIEIIGEIDIPGVVLVTVKNSLEVEALPADLPDKFEVDISNLKEVGDSLTLADIKYDSTKIEIQLGEAGLNEPIVLLQEQKEEEEPEVVAESTEEDEDVKEGAKEIEGSEFPAGTGKKVEGKEEQKSTGK